MTIDTATFRNLVAAEVKGRATTHQQRYLEACPQRWIEHLTDLLANLDRQLADVEHRVATVRAAAESGALPLHTAVQEELALGQRADNATRFRVHVERRLGEVRERFADLAAMSPVEQRLHLLQQGVRRHRELIEQGADPDEVDAALWAVLDGEWRFPQAA
jgi:hypothetical protein